MTTLYQDPTLHSAIPVEIEIRHFNRFADALRAAMAAGDIATAREAFDDIEVLALYTESAEVRDLCKPYLLPN